MGKTYRRSIGRKVVRIAGLVLSMAGAGAAHAASTARTVSHATTPGYTGRVCDPVTLGAVANGQRDDTVAIQQSIDRCSKAGGGTVPLHKGVYISGPLTLSSHVTLFLEPHSRLRAIGRRARYGWAFIGTAPRPREAFIMATNVIDVAILGTGTIDGDGRRLWWPAALAAKAAVERGATTYGARYPGVPTANGLPRPWLVEFANVKHARVDDVLLTDSPMWNLVIRDSGDIRISGLRIVNPATSPNTDGIDIVSSMAVSMSKVDIDTGDDDIAIKSGLPSFPTPKRPSVDISVADSTIRHGHGVSVGSETSNGIESVHMHNVHFVGTLAGIRIKSGRDRGADIGDIDASHLTMSDVAEPISVSDYYGGEAGTPTVPEPKSDAGQPVGKTTPHVHDVSIKDVDAQGATHAGMIVGLPEAPIARVVMRRVHIAAKESGLQLRNMQGTFDAVQIDSPAPTLRIEKNVRLNSKDHPK